MVIRSWLGLGLTLVLAGCSSGTTSDAGLTDAGNGDGALPDAGNRDGGGRDATSADAPPPTDVPRSDGANGDTGTPNLVVDFPDPAPDYPTRPSSTDGTYGSAPTTFVLPDRPGGDNGIIASDLATRYPQLATVDRLYIPAGHYNYLYLGGLPNRPADHPLVITNQGGQVLLDGGLAIDGGSNWALTGRYDPVSQTGDVGFPGHKNGQYASSSGRYGFHVHSNNQGGGCGYTVGGRATDFEIEFVEADNTGYCGVKLKTDNDPTATMRNVRFHDNYIHDTQGEGLYFCNSGDYDQQHRCEAFQVYNNRILRTGYETAQFEQSGEGIEIHHNVFGFGALNWLNQWSRDANQDNAFQLGPRTGRFHVHNNVVFGGAETELIVIAGHASTEPDNIDLVVENNYFSNSKDYAVYLGGGAPPSMFRLEGNVFRDFPFLWTRREGNVNPVTALVAMGSSAPLALVGNHYDTLADLSFDYTGPNGAGHSVTGTSNVFTASLPAVTFENLGYPAGAIYQALEAWRSTGVYNVAVNGDVEVPIPYATGALVMFNGTLYRALADNQQLQPDQHPEAWRPLAGFVDDVRLGADSPYRGVGLLDRAH